MGRKIRWETAGTGHHGIAVEASHSVLLFETCHAGDGQFYARSSYPPWQEQLEIGRTFLDEQAAQGACQLLVDRLAGQLARPIDLRFRPPQHGTRFAQAGPFLFSIADYPQAGRGQFLATCDFDDLNRRLGPSNPHGSVRSAKAVCLRTVEWLSDQIQDPQETVCPAPSRPVAPKVSTRRSKTPASSAHAGSSPISAASR